MAATVYCESVVSRLPSPKAFINKAAGHALQPPNNCVMYSRSLLVTQGTLVCPPWRLLGLAEPPKGLKCPTTGSAAMVLGRYLVFVYRRLGDYL